LPNVSAGTLASSNPLHRQANAKTEHARSQPIRVDTEVDAWRSLLLNRRRLVE